MFTVADLIDTVQRASVADTLEKAKAKAKRDAQAARLTASAKLE